MACIAETMASQAEPFTFALNLKRHHWHSLIIPFVERAAHAAAPLSVVALNDATGRVDGCMITEDWLAPRPLSYRMHLSSAWEPVRAAFGELHNRYQEREGQQRKGHTLRVVYFSCVRWAGPARAHVRGAPSTHTTHTHTHTHTSPACITLAAPPPQSRRCTLARAGRTS